VAIIEKKIYGVDAVINYVIGLGVPTATSEIEKGTLIARHNLESAYYSELTEAAFSLGYFDVSEVIEVTGYDDGYSRYYILYKINKTDEHFEKCYEEIESIYIQNQIGKIIDTAADTLFASAQNTAFLSTLNRAGISME
jgi:hypothetical protein